MKVEVRDGSRERRILTGMVLSNSVLGRLVPIWKEARFSSRWANIVAEWCVDYHKRYNTAPGKSVTALFEAWAEKSPDDDTTSLVEKFLASLSDEYEQTDEEINPAQILDIAGEHFNKVALTKHQEELEAALQTGQIANAVSIASNFKRVETGKSAGTHIFQDREAVLSYFTSDKTEPIFSYGRSALGDFFQNVLHRNSFVAFTGPDKSGKSFWLMDIAWRAMINRKKVAYFEVGDMSEDQVAFRLLTRAARKPIESPTGLWPCSIRKPKTITPQKDDETTAQLTYDVFDFKKPISPAEAWVECERTMKEKVKSKKSHLCISCHSADSISVAGIKSILETWELEDFVADVVVIDYADLLEPIDRRQQDLKVQIDQTWKAMRALSTDKHCLVVTATQSDAEAYDRKTLSRRNFSDCKKKNAHVTAMIGINQTDEEKENQVCRLNHIVKRKGVFSAKRCVHVGQCLALANPSVVSTF